MLSESKLKAALKALDAINSDLVDGRDAEDAKRLKESGVVGAKDADTNIDDEGGGLGDKSPAENGEVTESTQEADDDGQSDDGEFNGKDDDDSAEGGFMKDLEEMAASNSSAKSVRDMMLDDDEDEEESQSRGR